MKKNLNKVRAFLTIKKLILFVTLLTFFSIFISYMISMYRLKETSSLMRAMGVVSSDGHMLYCEEKFQNMALIKVVVDFDNRMIMTYGRYYDIEVNPGTNLLYRTSGDVNGMLTKGYINQDGIPSFIIFLFDRASDKYSISSMNGITGETQWSHDIVCKY